jgi:EF-P beta-lysylation protein EpmB
LLLQVLPSGEELVGTPGFSEDPLAETEALWEPGLLAKYAGRVLMVTTGACGVHCRFCFRRHFPYQDPAAALCLWEPALARVAADSSVREVILSGGDPLTLTDSKLQRLVDRLAELPHVARLRVHTRLPIVIPERVTDGLLACLRGRLAAWMVVHVNHAAEIDAAVAEALGRLVDAGIPVLSQSVLLRGVNDRVEVLAELFERLADLRVVPYYLHQLDRVAGAAHFHVPEETGIELVAALRARLPGYAVPRYVREIVGEPNKRVL